jgi:hypothetical protein
VFVSEGERAVAVVAALLADSTIAFTGADAPRRRVFCRLDPSWASQPTETARRPPATAAIQ